MDTLPKKQSDDSFSFAGAYPAEPNVSPVQSPPVPSQAGDPLSPSVPEPFNPVPPQTPQSPGGVVSTVPQEPFPPDNAPVVSGIPEGISPPIPPDNPFVVPAPEPPPPKNSSGIVKRLLGIIILIVALIVLGVVGFKVVGQLLTRNQPTVLTYWGLWENEQVLTSLIAKYKQTHPNVEISYSKQSPKQYRERLQAAIERGDGPDIFRFHASWLPMLKNDLAAAGATGYQAAEFQTTFYPVAAKDLIVSGKVYGVPLMIEGLGLYYNEDLLRAGGILPPTTWEEFRAAALALTVRNEAGEIVTSGAALGTTNNVEHYSDIVGLMMLQNGADATKPTSKEAQDSLSFYHLFAEEPNRVWNETLDNSITAFASGRVAFIFAPSWQVFTIRDINPNLKFQVIPVPQLPGTTVTWASYWVEGVASKSKQTDAAWEFLKFLSSRESMVSLYTEQAKLRPFGEPYSRVDLAQTIINDPYVGAYIKQAQTAQSFFLASRTFDNGINDRMIKYLEDAINSLGKGVSVAAALETASQGFTQVLNSFGYSPSAR